MNTLFEKNINCPYCGETITVLIDCSSGTDQYIEDCHVCCRPIVFKIELTEEDEPLVSVYNENEI